MDAVRLSFSDHLNVISSTLAAYGGGIFEIGRSMVETIRQDGSIIWCGNGGSAADSQHLAAELVGRFKIERTPIRSIALNSDTSIITSLANDYGYNNIFSRQVLAIGRPNDLLVAISTSGNSENVNSAVITAKSSGLKTVALTGKNGGRLVKLADSSIVVPSDDTARIQEAHILIGHCFCDIIEKELFPKIKR